MLALSTVVAFAWGTSVDGPDVFGKTTVIATEGNVRESLVVQCDSKDTLYVAYIFRKKEFEDVTNFPATLYIQANSKAPLKLDAALRSWNDNYGGIVASGKTKSLMAAIREIETAKSKINIGIEIRGNQQSASFGSRGSTKAMQRAIKECRLAEIDDTSS